MATNDAIVERLQRSSPKQLPLRQLKIALKHICDEAIPLHTNQLETHHHNIAQYECTQQNKMLFKERIDASKTIRLLNADVRELEKLSKLVMPEDEEAFKLIVEPTKKKLCVAIQAFNDSHSNLTIDSVISSVLSEENIPWCESESSNDSAINLQLIESIGDRNSDLVSWQSLNKDINDLNSMMNTMASVVCEQREQLDRIDTHIDSASHNIYRGTNHLFKALKLKTSYLPLTAAAFGGAVFGPIGLLAGFKVSGIACAVGASIVGYSGGKYFQKKLISEQEIEMNSIQTDDDLNQKKLI